MAESAELRGLSAEEITAQVKELEQNLFNLRFQSSLGKLENTAQIRLARRDLARAKTILREKRPPEPGGPEGQKGQG